MNYFNNLPEELQMYIKHLALMDELEEFLLLNLVAKETMYASGYDKQITSHFFDRNRTRHLRRMQRAQCLIDFSGDLDQMLYLEWNYARI